MWSLFPGGGGGGTQIWFRWGCAAEATKPVPIFKGHFGFKIKGYPLLGVLSDENGRKYLVFTVKLQNYTPWLGIFGPKPLRYPLLGILLRKSHPLERHSPAYLIR